MSARERLVLDVGLFVALLVASNPAWTGLAVHEWLSIAVITPLLVHLVLNWDWAVKVAARFSRTLLATSRLNLVVDVILFVATVAVMLSGLIVSQTIAAFLGVSGATSAVWYALHSVSADTVIVLLAVHLGLHWRWIARVLGLLDTQRTASGQFPATATTRVPIAGARVLAVQPVRMPAEHSRQRSQ